MIRTPSRVLPSLHVGLACALLGSAAGAQEAQAPGSLILLPNLSGAAELDAAPLPEAGESLSLEAIGLGDPAAGATGPAPSTRADDGVPELAVPTVVRHIAPLWPEDISRVSQGRAQLRGEREALAFSLLVPPGARPEALSVVAVSSAFVDPARSRLLVYVEDALVGEVPLESITTPRDVRLPLPAGLLKPGQNRVRIESELVHRLYCGATASYDLWTNVDLATSGAVHAPEAARPGEAGFLAAATVARSGGRALLVKADPDPANRRLLADLGRELALAVGGGSTFTGASDEATAPASGPAPAIELRRGVLPHVGYRLDPDGRQVMEVVATDGVLPPLFRSETVLGRALPPPVLEPDVSTPLANLGFDGAQVLVNRWNAEVQFRLPDDWLLNVRSRATLRLAYEHLANLPAGSVLRVRVNEEAVRIVPLEGTRRAAAEPLEVRFDVGHLRSGRNVLRFEVEISGAPETQPCLDQKVARVEISPNTTLLVPGSASMHVAGLGRWMSPMDRDVAVAGRLDDAANWPFEMRVAAALRNVAVGDRAGAGERRLIVHRASALAEGAFASSGISAQAVVAALRDERRSLPVGAASAAAEPVLFEEGGRVSALLGDMTLWATASWRDLAAMLRPDAVADLERWLASTPGQALLLQPDPAAPDDVHLVLAADADLDEVVGALETVSTRGIPLAGHAAMLDRDSRWRLWSDGSRLPVLEDEINETNWRGVIGNFASARPAWFAGTILLLAGLSVFLANSYVAASRRSR